MAQLPACDATIRRKLEAYATERSDSYFANDAQHVVPDRSTPRCVLLSASLILWTLLDACDLHQEWIHACKTGEPTLCNFDYSGKLIEHDLLGNVSYRVGEILPYVGSRDFRTEDRLERLDTKYVQAILELDTAPDVPIGLLVLCERMATSLDVP